MIKTFIPIDNYAFDVDELKSDLQRIEAVYPDKTTYWLTMLTREAADDMISLYDTSYVKHLYPPEAFKDLPALFRSNREKLSMGNFHFYMKGTYTHEILLKLDADMRSKGQRITSVLYHKLTPGKCHLMHTDMMETRFHIPVITNQHAYFLMENGKGTDDYEIWRMQEVGKMHVFIPSAMHTAINTGFESRTHLIVDYVDL